MPRHVIGEVRHDDGPAPSFLNRSAVDLKEVEVAIDVDLAVLIVHDRRRWQDLTIILREVEERLKFVDVVALHEAGRVQRDLEPLRHGQLFVATDTTVLILLFIDSHVHIERG